jgi:hypothetical protein
LIRGLPLPAVATPWTMRKRAATRKGFRAVVSLILSSLEP